MTLERTQQQIDIEEEAQAVRVVRQFSRDHARELRNLFHWGDGHGAGLLGIMAEELGLVPRRSPARVGALKKPIPGALSKAVMERDAYRCQHCGGHVDLCCDHIHPECFGGTATLSNLQTLCRSCNSKKGVRP